jgi:chromate transporter
MNLLEYFWIFLKASLFSFGGLGNLPFLQRDLTALGWANPQDFITAVAVGQISPGPNGVWSISLGYLTYGWLGSLLALVALSLPTLLTLAINAFFNLMQKSLAAQGFIRGLALGVVGLTLAVTYNLAGTAIVDWLSVLIALGALGLALSKKVPVIAILAIAAVIGLLTYRG